MLQSERCTPGLRGGLLVTPGARLVADAEQLSTLTAHWRYQGVKHAEREMVRVEAIESQ